MSSWNFLENHGFNYGLSIILVFSSTLSLNSCSCFLVFFVLGPIINKLTIHVIWITNYLVFHTCRVCQYNLDGCNTFSLSMPLQIDTTLFLLECKNLDYYQQNLQFQTSEDIIISQVVETVSETDSLFSRKLKHDQRFLINETNKKLNVWIFSAEKFFFVWEEGFSIICTQI